ncbi:MAG: DsbA family protein [Candidatus Nitrosotenuis sp.]
MEGIKTSSSRKIGIAAGIGTAIAIAALFSLWYMGQGSFPIQETKSEFGQIIGTVGESTPLQTTEKKIAGSVNFDIPEFAKYRGSENAQINLVEFGDYQCPFCKRFFDQTEPQIMQEYVDSGKTKFYFLDVSIVGEDSLVLGQGSWCADEQGKYWEYHDYMYANQGEENSGWGTPEKVKFMARNISGLDVDKFSQCLDDKKYESRSRQLTQFANQIGLTGTPTMFVGTAERGYIKITGAQPYEVFKKVIDAHLE